MPDLSQVPPDLSPPLVSAAPAGAGRRVREQLPEFTGSDLFHTLYLPGDWQRDRTYPVLIECPGNGPYRNAFGDRCSGSVDECRLGYGISAGMGFIWACLPCVAPDRHTAQRQWWGDIDATVDYYRRGVQHIVANYGGDASAVFMTGFSRGAIACSYIGLHDDAIAGLWRGLIAHSHFDGVRRWSAYHDSDPSASRKRLARLDGRPVFVSQEGSTRDIEAFVTDLGLAGQFTFAPIPYRNHTDAWVLRDLPQRRQLRAWVRGVLASRR